MRTILLLAVAAGILSGADNVLTPAESASGWKLLFDGKTFDNWRNPAKEIPPGDAWVIEDGTLATVLHPRIEEDLVSAKTYRDYELAFDWRVSPGANTGLKYRIQKLIFASHETETQTGPIGFEAMLDHIRAMPGPDRSELKPGQKAFEYPVAYEFQLIDDARHPDAKTDSHVTGALYSMIPPARHAARPAGEWNTSRLVLKGNHFEHWINGVQVLSGSLDDPEGLNNLQKRWAKGRGIYDLLAHAAPAGPFSLQHHGDKVWFKNIKIREY